MSPEEEYQECRGVRQCVSLRSQTGHPVQRVCSNSVVSSALSALILAAQSRLEAHAFGRRGSARACRRIITRVCGARSNCCGHNRAARVELPVLDTSVLARGVDLFDALETLDENPHALGRRIVVSGLWRPSDRGICAAVFRRVMACCAADAINVGFDVLPARAVSFAAGMPGCQRRGRVRPSRR